MSIFAAMLWLYLLTGKKMICDCETNSGITAMVPTCYFRLFIILVNNIIKLTFCMH